MSFPPPPAADVDWSKLSIDVNDIVAGHIESKYTPETGKWSAPVFVKDPYLRVHGLSPAFNYGMQAYEGLKAHRSVNTGDIILFRPSKHAQRMQKSTAMVSIPTIPLEHFNTCVELAVAHNAAYVPPASSGGALYVRPVAFGTSGHLALTPPKDFLFAVYVQPFGTYHGVQPIPALILEDFDRAAEKGTGNAKVGGNYAPAIKWMDWARKEGFPITLHLDSKTRSEIDEFSTSGFIGIREAPNGTITMVVPDSKNVIESVTSDSCQELAKSFGWRLEVRPIKTSELEYFTEVFAAGTAAAIVPIKSISYRSIGETYIYVKNDIPAAQQTKYHARLYDALKGIQRGELKDPFGWVKVIKAPEEYESGVNGTLNGKVNGLKVGEKEVTA